jgi:hypothetical protein
MGRLATDEQAAGTSPGEGSEVRRAQHPEWPRRLALVLTRDEAIDRLNEVFVVLVTTNIRGLPTEDELGLADGMPRAAL